jgi:tRNA-specific 2-thiouridylase
VGHLEKAEVRRLAGEAGLGVALKAESQEICFVPDGDYAGFVERSAAPADRGGPILDTGGREIGRHAGVHRFTVGQRRGLGLASSRPLYVLAVRPESHAVVVGEADQLLADRLVARDVNWLSIAEPAGAIRARARIRYRHAEADASIRPLAGGRAEVRFDAPQRAVTPGQAVVFYDGEVCLGGGWIE